MILSIGDLVVDILVQHKEKNYGTDVEGNIQFSAGGQSNNVAAWVAHADVESKLIGIVGRDVFGDFLIKEATDLGVRCLVDIHETVETGRILIIIEEDGERSMITSRGANLYLTEEYIYKNEDSIKAAEVLYLSGYSIFAENPLNAIHVAKNLAVEHGVKIAIDPSSVYYLKTQKEQFLKFLDGVSFLFPNYEEGIELTGEENPEKILKRLREFVPYPVLKLGEKGCLIYFGGAYISVTTPHVKAIDTTGAGDSFVGTFLAHYNQSKDIVVAANEAVQAAARMVQFIGARPKI